MTADSEGRGARGALRSFCFVWLLAAVLLVPGACRDPPGESPSAPGDAAIQRTVVSLIDFLEGRGELAAVQRHAAEVKPRLGLDSLVLLVVQYLSLPEAERGRACGDPLTEFSLRLLLEDDGRLLRQGLRREYLGEGATELRRSPEGSFAHTVIGCIGPWRAASGRPEKTLRFMGLRPGDSIADVGAGPGYFSLLFAQAVGPTGHVYALDTNALFAARYAPFFREQGLPQVELRTSRRRSIDLPPHSLDQAFMTRLYLDIERFTDEETKRALFGSIRAALRPEGRFVVCESAPPPAPVTLDMAIERLKGYGFQLVEELRFAPTDACLKLRP